MRIRGVRIPAGVPPALAVALCFALVLVAADFFPIGNPHAHFQNAQQCAKCHLSNRGKMEPDRFSTETDAVCLECHAKDSTGRSHPVNVRPEEKFGKMKVPADLRLDDDGRIMCLTCHTAHGSYVSYFLRRASPDRGFEVLCEACHEKR